MKIKDLEKALNGLFASYGVTDVNVIKEILESSEEQIRKQLNNEV